MQKVLIFGGTGFIGLSLADHLANNGLRPILLARKKPDSSVKHEFLQWDAISPGDWINELNDTKAIVNLAGKTVDCIKTPDNCDLILRSRVDSTKATFRDAIDFDPIESIKTKKTEELPVDYFQFYNSISSVYSSKIEGENIDFDSFYKFKFLEVPYNPDYTKKPEYLFRAYEFIQTLRLNPENIFAAHAMLSKHLLPQNQQGKIRTNPMFVINEQDRIEYVACEPGKVEDELKVFFGKIEELLATKMPDVEAFFYAAQIHLVFVKIHPFPDGNGRMARLLEKWFLLEKLGQDAVAVELEKNYFIHRDDYYSNLRSLGLEYQVLDYSRALPFLLMTVNSLK